MRTSGAPTDGAAAYPWHARAWQQLCALRSAGILPPALLLAGAPGSGVEQLGRRFQLWMLCRKAGEEGACGICNPCKQAAVGMHPGAMRLAPSGKSNTISVDDVRRVLEYLDLRTSGKEARVLLISPAENMNKAAANALLKILEEPGESKHFLLAAQLPGRLLPTVRSRCVRVPCAPAATLSQNWLAKDLGDPEMAQRCLQLAAGAPLTARELVREGTLSQWEDFYSSFHAWLTGHQTLPEVAALWQQIAPQQLLIWQMLIAAELARKMLASHTPRLEEIAKLPPPPANLPALFRIMDTLRQHRQRILEGVTATEPLWLEDLALRWRSLGVM